MQWFNDEVRYMREDRIRRLMEPFGFTFEGFVFDCGYRLRVKGPGVPFLCSGVEECGDKWTAAGMAMQKLIDAGCVPEVVLEILAERGE